MKSYIITIKVIFTKLLFYPVCLGLKASIPFSKIESLQIFKNILKIYLHIHVSVLDTET